MKYVFWRVGLVVGEEDYQKNSFQELGFKKSILSHWQISFSFTLYPFFFLLTSEWWYYVACLHHNGKLEM